MMKVVFLDIDGVLQPYNSRKRFEIRDEDKKELMKKLAKEMGIDESDFLETCHSYDVAAVYADWDKDAVERIRKILDVTGAKIVLSSDWRDIDVPKKMEYLLRIKGLDKYLVGQTDYYLRLEVPEERKEYGYRTCEILHYLDTHKEVTNYVAIDDGIRSTELAGHLVETYNLINDEQMNEAIEILQRS